MCVCAEYMFVCVRVRDFEILGEREGFMEVGAYRGVRMLTHRSVNLRTWVLNGKATHRGLRCGVDRGSNQRAFLVQKNTTHCGVLCTAHRSLYLHRKYRSIRLFFYREKHNY